MEEAEHKDIMGPREISQMIHRKMRLFPWKQKNRFKWGRSIITS
jgi:hypothetical protein